ncbi:hypothetical protein V3481_002680 [Fusarium oxysporum f. sp. vasinfectum]
MPQKRKRPDQDPSEQELLPASALKSTSSDSQSKSASARRATRQTPVIPPTPPTPVTQLQPQPRTETAVPPPIIPTLSSASSKPTPSPEQKRSRASNGRPQLPPSQPKAQSQHPPSVLRWAPLEQPGPAVRHPPHHLHPTTMAAMPPPRPIAAGRPPSDLVAPEITYHVPQSHTNSFQRTSALVRPHGPTAQPPRILERPPPPTVTPVHPPKPPVPPSVRPPLRADRNIDKVVLGNMCFSTWYPSYYGKEVLGESSGNLGKTGSKDLGAKDQATGGKSSSRRDREHHPVVDRLYVCPTCFKYSKELVAWCHHVHVCERKTHIPGRKVYVHPRGRRKILVPHDNKTSGPKRRKGEGNIRLVEEIVQDEGEWSIWEVDGEKDGVRVSIMSRRAPMLTFALSSFARTCHSSQSSSSTINPSSSMSQVLTTSYLFTHLRLDLCRLRPSLSPLRLELRDSFRRRKCHGIITTSLASLYSPHGSERVLVRC